MYKRANDRLREARYSARFMAKSVSENPAGVIVKGGFQGKVFLWPLRVYYDDTDAGGIVYHAAYLRMMEHARTEWLRALGFEQDRLAGSEGVIFAVSALSIRYRRPARFNDELVVSTALSRRQGASLLFRQAVRRGGADGELLCDAEVRVVSVDSTALRPARLPITILEELDSHGL